MCPVNWFKLALILHFMPMTISSPIYTCSNKINFLFLYIFFHTSVCVCAQLSRYKFTWRVESSQHLPAVHKGNRCCVDSPSRVKRNNSMSSEQFQILPWCYLNFQTSFAFEGLQELWMTYIPTAWKWNSHWILQHIYTNLNRNGALAWFYLGPK